MDNHQLIASGDAQEIRTSDGNMVATTDHHLVRRARSEKQDFVREIVRRFNAYERLVSVIRLAVESGPIANADPNTHALLKEAMDDTKTSD